MEDRAEQYYIEGVVFINNGQYPEALASFDKATGLTQITPRHGAVGGMCYVNVVVIQKRSPRMTKDLPSSQIPLKCGTSVETR